MNKNNIKEKLSSNNYTDISEIEEKIDRMIPKNKEKLKKIQSDKIDLKKISLKNKNGGTIYYLRKKSNKNNYHSDDLNEKVISESVDSTGNFNKDFIDNQKKLQGSKSVDIEEKKKKRLKIWKKTKNVNNYSAIPQNSEDLLKYDEFDKKIAIFNNIQANKIPIKTDEESKIIDEKILEASDINDSQEKQYNVEKKATELAKKHDFFTKNETDWLSNCTDNLVELKKKYKQNITIPDFHLSKLKEPNKDESSLLDEKITESLIAEERDKKEIEINEKKEKYNLKKSIFKRKKLFDDKAFDLKQKEKFRISKEDEALKVEKKIDDNDKQEIIKSKKSLSISKKIIPFIKKTNHSEDKNVILEQKETKPTILKRKTILRIDHLPKSKDQNKEKIKFSDKEIKDTSKIVDFTNEKNKEKTGAFKPVQKNIKDISKPIDDKKLSFIKMEKSDIDIPLGVPLSEEGTDHEHVFFDEKDTSYDRWNSQIREETKEELSFPLKTKGKIKDDVLTALGEIELPKESLQTKTVKIKELGFSEKEWEELEYYSLYEPFAYVEILREKESFDKCYYLVEIDLTEKEVELLDFVEGSMKNLEINAKEIEEKNKNEYLLERLNQIIEDYDLEIDEESRNKIFYYIGKTSLGLGRIDPLMRDPNIEDISCDGSGVPIFLYHRKYGSLQSNIRFNDEEELSSFVHKLAQKCGKHISIAEPMLDATMPDGSRIQMTLGDEITAKGSTFTIRKFRSDPFSPPDLVEFNTMSSEMIAYMWIAVENGINTLFAGGTASGKTTALNALTLFIPCESKIVSIEETREINLPHPNWIPGVSRSGFGEVVADKVVGEIDMYDLMKAALRQRPEYIIVGEIRGREAYVLFQAMATGHATYSTTHADSAQSLIHRLEGKPINIPRVMLQSLDIVCLHVITRVNNIRARRCKQIIEIIDIDPTTKEILTNEVFRWESLEDKFVYSGKSYILERVRAEKDMTREEMTNEVKNRKLIVEWMNKNNIREFREVAKIVTQYNENPNDIMKMIESSEKNK